jgi:hypothetical protein
VKARRRGPAGVEEQGKGTLEFSGNLGGPQNVLEQNDPERMNRENNIQALWLRLSGLNERSRRVNSRYSGTTAKGSSRRGVRSS